MTSIEKLTRDRSRIILLMALTFTLWQGAHIATRLLPEGTSGFVYASITVAVGAVAYVATAIGLWVFQRRVRKANAGCTLNDDWAKHIRAMSMQYGFIFLIGAIALMYAASQFLDLPVIAVLQGLLLIGVVSTLLAYVWLERKGEGAE